MSLSIAARKFNIVKLIFSKFKFNENLKNLILCFYWNILDYKKKVLLNWINIDKIQWNSLSKNIYAYDLLKDNQDKICWNSLSKNIYAIDLLEKNQDKINWNNLCLNKNAIHILENNLDKVDWNNLSLNKNAIHILKENKDKIDWFNLSLNPSIFENEPIPKIL